jgi:PAS domain S-box-containing protein
MPVDWYRALFEEAADGMLVADARGRYVSANLAAIRLTGYTAEELAGMTLADLVPDAAGGSRQPQLAECLLRRKDGTLLTVGITNRPLPEGGRLEIVKDVAERQGIEDALRLWHQAIESSINGIAFADLQGRLTYANPSFLEMWGYDRADEALGAFAPSLADSPEEVQGILADVLRDGRWVGQSVAKKKNGERFVVSLSATMVKNVAGQPVAVMGSFIDVTKRKQAEEALRASEEKYRMLVESAQDPMFTSDIDGRYLYVNAAAAATLGTTPEHVIGKTVDELFSPSVASAYRAGVRHVFETGESVKGQDRSEINGREFWFSSIVQPVRDSEGKVVAAQAIVRDITSLKQAEEALRESEERLRQVILTSNIGIFDHNHVTDELYWSLQNREIWGVGPDEPISAKGLREPPDNPAYLRLIHPDDRDRIQQATEQAHHGGDGLYEVEHRVVRRDGTVRWVIIRAQTFFEGEGRSRHPVRTIGAVRDVTEQKQAEEEREKLQAQLVQAQKMELVGRLAGGVAHDFNNMLNVILGHTELAMKQVAPSHAIQTDLEQVLQAAQRSADLTRQLLGFARKQPVSPKVLDLNEFVAASIKMLRRLIGEDISLVSSAGPDLWPVQIDPTQVDQVLANLSANSRDAISGVGQITIATQNVVLDDSYCARHPGSVPGSYVMLEVADDGHGMDRETLAHVFEPFYTTKADGQGTGLGLATVYGIVKQNGGFITVSSEVGRGTRVTIFLPRAARELQKAETGDEEEEPLGGTETILLVEDEPLLLRFSRISLERMGYTVFPASTPAEAIRLAEENAGKIQLLVTDVVMPEMNGRELAARLTARTPQLKCLFVSGYFSNAIQPDGASEFGAHFLQKPFSRNLLAAKVRQVLEARGRTNVS